VKRVVITGVGTVSALGNNAREFWESLKAGRSGIGPITKADVSTMRFTNAAEVRGFDASQHFDDKALLWLDPFSHFGIVAAREAVADSGIEFTPDLRETERGYYGFMSWWEDNRGRAVLQTLRRG
jgi:3-oxoacyl-(acyl-carrier-protein) synthase